MLGKDIEFGKPALYIETSSEDLVLVSDMIFFFIYFKNNFIIVDVCFQKERLLQILNLDYCSLPPPPLNGIEPSLITN